MTVKFVATFVRLNLTKFTGLGKWRGGTQSHRLYEDLKVTKVVLETFSVVLRNSCTREKKAFI